MERKFAFGKPLAPFHQFVPLTGEKTQLFDFAAQPNGSSGSFGGELLDISEKATRDTRPPLRGRPRTLVTSHWSRLGVKVFKLIQVMELKLRLGTRVIAAHSRGPQQPGPCKPRCVPLTLEWT
jgi:hypothetical protein